MAWLQITACVTLALALLLSCVIIHSAPYNEQPKLRFVAQLSVNGCPIFVHDTGANDGPHLAVEPLMCVTQLSLRKLLPRYDPITQQRYVSVPVMLRDDAMLTEVEHQLRHLSPKSVKFATVSDISVSIENSTEIQALGFDWAPGVSTGILRMGCEMPINSNSSLRMISMCNFNKTFSKNTLQSCPDFTMGVELLINDTSRSFKYAISTQNTNLINQIVSSDRYSDLTTCNMSRSFEPIDLKNCTAQVHERLDMKGHFLIEPLLCHNITSFINEPIMYDYSRDLYYLKLDVVLQDDITLDAVRSKLAHLSPLNVTFMQLWRAENVVTSVLNGSFEIGGLMVSGDWRSGQVKVYCRNEDDCINLRSSIIMEPEDLWRQIKWSVTAIALDGCQKTFYERKFFWDVPTVSTLQSWLGCPNLSAATCKYIRTNKNRTFVTILQRLRGIMNFQRPWSNYEDGFGDETDFWIGLSRIHSLSINSVTLRVEMKLWNGTELHAEYAGFKVGDASTNYTMTYREMIKGKSSISFDGMRGHNGMQFSTMDRVNDRGKRPCSKLYGNGGWWFNACYDSNPNGIYGDTESVSGAGMSWSSGPSEKTDLHPLREVRLMLQI